MPDIINPESASADTETVHQEDHARASMYSSSCSNNLGMQPSIVESPHAASDPHMPLSESGLQRRVTTPSAAHISASSPTAAQTGPAASAYAMPPLHASRPPPVSFPKSHRPISASTDEHRDVVITTDKVIETSVSVADNDSTKHRSDDRQPTPPLNIQTSASRLSTGPSFENAAAKPTLPVESPPYPVASILLGDDGSHSLGGTPVSGDRLTGMPTQFENDVTSSNERLGCNTSFEVGTAKNPAGSVVVQPQSFSVTKEIPRKVDGSNVEPGLPGELRVVGNTNSESISAAPRPNDISEMKKVAEKGAPLHRRNFGPSSPTSSAKIQATLLKARQKTLAVARSSPKPSARSLQKSPSKPRVGPFSQSGSSSSGSAPFGYPNYQITSEQIMEAMPENASSIFHIMDRRINFDALPPDASFYSLLRSWVQDDPYRKIPPSGSNLLEYADLPSERRVFEEDTLSHSGETPSRKRKLDRHDVLSQITRGEGHVVPSLYQLRCTLTARAKRKKEQKRNERREKDAVCAQRLKSLGINLPLPKR